MAKLLREGRGDECGPGIGLACARARTSGAKVCIARSTLSSASREEARGSRLSSATDVGSKGPSRRP